MSLAAIIATAHEQNDYSLLLQAVPYAKTIGLTCTGSKNNLLFTLEQKVTNLGNPILPAIHGGTLGGAMELAAGVYLLVFDYTKSMPKIVDFSLDYLRAGLYKKTYIECTMTRKGNRVANISVSAWQTTPETPIATARAHFLYGK